METHRESLFEDESSLESLPLESMVVPVGDNTPATLQGNLYYRLGRSAGSTRKWRRKDVVLDLTTGGIILGTEKHPKKGDDSEHLVSSISSNRLVESGVTVELEIPAQLDYRVKDVQNDASTFLIEVDMSTEATESVGESFPSKLLRAMEKSQEKGKGLRIYLACTHMNEKTLWLSAFHRLGRLSEQLREKRGWQAVSGSSFFSSKRRIRSAQSRKFIEESSILLNNGMESEELHDPAPIENPQPSSPSPSVPPRKRRDSSKWKRENVKSDETEYLVYPKYAYPNRWMTRKELRKEMLKPSETFHDLRTADSKRQEIGTLRVEILECRGLPKLDFASATDPLVYLVCGSYVFVSDVIWDRYHPMWPAKSRRACVFPIYDGFARLFAGVFDDDGEHFNDDFAGRVVVDLARCRPHSTYDVTLPLRTSAHTYATSARGTIRLRFSLTWNSEKAALMSYLPDKIIVPTKQRPMDDVTVLCADEKAFRNVAITVHGVNMPGQFSFQYLRATALELDFTQKVAYTAVVTFLYEVMFWKRPGLSSLILVAWMHSVYINEFSLILAYCGLVFSIVLMKNYFLFYGTNGPFAPPRWREIFSAMIGKEKPIDPLEINPSSDQSNEPSENFEPLGEKFFRFFGTSDEFDAERPRMNEMEFPFSRGLHYRKRTVEKALVPKPKTIIGFSMGKTQDDMGDRGMDDFAQGGNTVDDEEMDLVLSRIFADTGTSTISNLKYAAGSGVNVLGTVAGTGINTIGTVAGTGINIIGQAAGTGISTLGSAAGTGISTLGSAADTGISKIGLKKPLKRIKKKAGSGIKNVGNAAGSGIRTVGNAADTGISKIGLKKVGKAIGKTAGTGVTKIGNAAGTGIDKIGLKKVGHAIGSAAGSGISTAKGGLKKLKKSIGSSKKSMHSLMNEDEAHRADRLPEQNIHVRVKQTKTIEEELKDFQNFMHMYTFHSFHDRTHVMRKREQYYFGKTEDEWKGNNEVNDDLERLLGTGAYCNFNPIVARIGVYLEPLIGAAHSGLAFFRALYNLLTWQDPMLSFWLSMFSFAWTIVMFLFPWRLFLLFTGVILIGPQNWLIRKLHENNWLPASIEGALFPDSTKKQRFTEESMSLPEGLPIICSQRRDGKPYVELKREDVDLREVHEVSVPYSRFMHQRFYDWPPEPRYARVKKGDLSERKQRYNEMAMQTSFANMSTLNKSIAIPGLDTSMNIPELDTSMNIPELDTSNRLSPDSVASTSGSFR